MTTMFRREMDDGHTDLSANRLRAALHHFTMAVHSGENPAEQAEADQMVGVAFRKDGKLHRAAKYGYRALAEAESTDQPRLISGVARDLAATLHHEGVCTRDNRAKHLRDALRYFQHSIAYDAAAREWKYGRNLPGPEYYVTHGMEALLRYDLSHYRIWINDDGSEALGRLSRSEARAEQRNAINAIREADRYLRAFDNRVWELNNLLKLIQVAPFIERAPLVHRAEQLTVLFPERRREIWVALLGRRFMRCAIALQVWRKRR